MIKIYKKTICVLVSIMMLSMIPMNVLAITANEYYVPYPISNGDYIICDTWDGVLINSYHGRGGDIDYNNIMPGTGHVDIGQHAFQYVTSLTGINLSRAGVIEQHAFVGCTNLKTVEYRNNRMYELTTIQYEAFKDCTALTSIYLPECLTNIGVDAFKGCINLTIYGVKGSYAEDYAKQNNIPFVGEGSPTIKLQYRTHIQNFGWDYWRNNGERSGTTGQGLRLEGIQIIGRGLNEEAFHVHYNTHIENIGWQGWKNNGELSGTSGQSLRLEAIGIQLCDTHDLYNTDNYDIYYRVHAENFGWLDWASNGYAAGTAGFGYRLEAIEIKMVPKGAAAPGPTAMPFVDSSLGVGSIPDSFQEQ